MAGVIQGEVLKVEGSHYEVQTREGQKVWFNPKFEVHQNGFPSIGEHVLAVQEEDGHFSIVTRCIVV